MSRLHVALDVSPVPAQPAGAGVYVVRLVEALVAGGEVDLSLLARAGDGRRWERLAPAAAVHPVAPGRRPLRLAWEQARGPAMARVLGVDLWHGPHYTMPLRSPVPTVVTVHDLTFFDHPEWHERGKVVFFRPMIRRVARRADGLVCVSEHTARRLREVLEPRGAVTVIPHGVDHELFRPEGEGDVELLAGHGVRPPYVAFAGTVEPRKNVAGLARAVARLRRRHPDLQLVVAGRRGWGGVDVEATPGVVRLGYVADGVVPALFRSAAAVAYPSLEEGFGLPALEALACGAPLVTSAGSAMEEVVGDAAVVVPPGDDEALATALERLLAGGPEVERLRRRGPEVAARHTWAASATAHVAAYRRAAAR
jgi:glycosyltransferase involved in cell wall biosynthesis